MPVIFIKSRKENTKDKENVVCFSFSEFDGKDMESFLKTNLIYVNIIRRKKNHNFDSFSLCFMGEMGLFSFAEIGFMFSLVTINEANVAKSSSQLTLTFVHLIFLSSWWRF